MFGDTPLIMVEDEASLLEAAAILEDDPIIGIDTEADSFHHYQEKVCLVQISNPKVDIIVDPIKVPDLSPLASIFADPSKIKIFHGADYDVVSLKRDFGFEIRNIFDTMLAAQFLGMPRIGLADLIKRFFGHTVDKQYQRHDWASRPLLPEHLYYARGDTHFLPALMDVLDLRLQQADLVAAHAEECKLVEERVWTGRTDVAPWLRVKGSSHLDDRSQHVLKALWTYRDGAAREMDRPAFKVIPDPVLLNISEQLPTDEEALAALARRGSPLLRRHGDALLAAVKAGLADEEPLPQAPPPDRGPARRRGGPSADQLLTPLKNWRNSAVNRLGLNPVVVVNNGLLKEISRLAPRTIEELAAIDGVRRWQVERFGAEIVQIVNGVDAPVSAAPSQGPKRRRRRGPRKAAEGAAET